MKDKFNFNFDENDVPFGVGDRYYAQDMVRDNRYLQSLALRATASICQKESGILKGLKISQSSPTIIGLTGGSGFCHFSVKVPDDSAEWTVPAHVKNEDILALVDVEAQAIQLTEEMLDGNLRYVKIRYKEENVNSRVRQNLGGSYTYVVADSYQLVIDENPATNYDILLGTFSGDGETLTVTSIKTELERIIDEAVDYAIDDTKTTVANVWSAEKIDELVNTYLIDDTAQGSNTDDHNFIVAKNITPKNGTTIKVTFTKDCYSATANTAPITSAYPKISVDNGVTYYPVYVNQHGTPIPIPSHQIVSRNSLANYHWWWQAYTTLEFMFVSDLGDNGAWLIMGDPETVSYNSSTENYKIKADGLIEQWIDKNINNDFWNYFIIFINVPIVIASINSNPANANIIIVREKTTSKCRVQIQNGYNSSNVSSKGILKAQGY